MINVNIHKTKKTMTLHTLKHSKIEDLNNIVSEWHGKVILKTNITGIELDHLGNIFSIKNEASHVPKHQEVYYSAKPFHIYSPKIDKNSFTYKTDQSEKESEKISDLWLDLQGDFLITLPHPLKFEVDDSPYTSISKTHWVDASPFGMLIFRSEKTDLKEINQKLAEFVRI